MRRRLRFLAIVSFGVLLSLARQGARAWPAQQPRSAQAAGTRATPPPEARTDINHASLAELLKVPGMTPSWAGRIVRFRPYRTKQDLLDRGVLPSDVYDRIKDYVIAHREKQ